ncbi:hypothetical protein EIL81_16050 [Photorhabdus laumondii subsp. laumondii]|nr:hypothetical protein PluDJC_01630 [Photorhabdus laumondii subsp. laumondii]AXG45637.1 hypothetical protein PluTT01m_01585 [Photorhabdus laumondii subsp. laumondii]MBS9429635.1 hypothetical protein [Photorhabdus akhurstii]MBS9435003.1 hypothetical protein [Photorhabdus hainanensis]MCZ1250345.1 hypothetical protein [Photorhabdus laumondii subsp. laumondii]
MAIDQNAKIGLSSLQGIYYFEKLFKFLDIMLHNTFAYKSAEINKHHQTHVYHAVLCPFQP